ncbi:keratin, type I cytoskeletal 10-like [Gastrophryne carolinensis]
MAAADIYCPNQKDTLMSLNTRLEAYLENVRELEESNQKLEEQIKKVSMVQKVGQDHRHYQKTIEDLESQSYHQGLCQQMAIQAMCKGFQGQANEVLLLPPDVLASRRSTTATDLPLGCLPTMIRHTKQANCEMWLNIENTKRTADGYKEKYETELALHNTIADDVKKLKATISGLEMEKHCLDVEVKILTEELETLKKDHEEERMRLLQEKSKCQVNVEIESLDTTELANCLEKMRKQFIAIADAHQKHYEAFLGEKVWRFMLSQTEKTAQEEVLNETEAGYIRQLEHIQEIVLRLEDALAKVRSEAENLSSDSRILCYLKDLLEMEIRTYGLMMDGEEDR